MLTNNMVHLPHFAVGLVSLFFGNNFCPLNVLVERALLSKNGDQESQKCRFSLGGAS
jgi:hypothetical protein